MGQRKSISVRDATYQKLEAWRVADPDPTWPTRSISGLVEQLINSELDRIEASQPPSDTQPPSF